MIYFLLSVYFFGLGWCAFGILRDPIGIIDTKTKIRYSIFSLIWPITVPLFLLLVPYVRKYK